MKYFVSFLFYYYCTEKVFLLSKTKKSKILPSQFSWWFSNSLAVIYFFHTKRKWNVYVRNTKRLMMIERNTKCSVNFFEKKKRFSFVGWWLTNCVVWWGQIALECINALWRRSAGGKVFTLFDKRVHKDYYGWSSILILICLNQIKKIPNLGSHKKKKKKYLIFLIHIPILKQHLYFTYYKLKLV